MACHSFRACAMTAAAVALGLVVADTALADPGKGRDQARRPAAHLKIPPGHLPPPGECRLWYPGRPPGHQPPPGSCASLHRRQPVDAWLIRRPAAQPEVVEIVSVATRDGGPAVERPSRDHPRRRSDLEIIIDVYEAITGERIDPAPPRR